MINPKKGVLIFLLLYTTLSFGQTKKEDEPLSGDEAAGPNISYESKEDNNIYNIAGIEVKPEYPEAGLESMYSFIRKNFVIPQEIIDSKSTKTLFASFIIEKDGSVTNIKIIRDVGYGTAEEAIRVIKLMPKWQPAKQSGKNVRCMYSIPIRLNAN